MVDNPLASPPFLSRDHQRPEETAVGPAGGRWGWRGGEEDKRVEPTSQLASNDHRP